MKTKNIYLLGLAVLSMAACKPRLISDAPSAGPLDFSSYVAVGNSLTAGYSSNSLYRSGQINSYPNILATQFRQVGGGDFKQPLLPGEYGVPGPKLILGYAPGFCDTTRSLGPIPNDAAPDTAGSLTNISAQGPYNNVGVPGIRTIDYLQPGYALGAYLLGGAPYAYRFYSSPSTEKPLDEALKIDATFYSVWLGNNDVLGYATNGGKGAASGTLPYDISPVATFKFVYDSVINALSRKGAKGVLMNIPDVTSIPFFTTVPYNGLPLRQGQADSLNAAYAGTGVTFTGGPNNTFVIQDTSVAVLKFRKIRAGELILLSIPQDSIKCAGWGTRKPIPANYVLTANEIVNIKNATTAFNQIILQNAQAHGWAYVDMNSYLKTISSGILYNGVNFNAVFVKGGAFSLDGVHLTPRGYALAANEIIRTINSYYGASVPMADINSYNGLLLP